MHISDFVFLDRNKPVVWWLWLRLKNWIKACDINEIIMFNFSGLRVKLLGLCICYLKVFIEFSSLFYFSLAMGLDSTLFSDHT